MFLSIQGPRHVMTGGEGGIQESSQMWCPAPLKMVSLKGSWIKSPVFVRRELCISKTHDISGIPPPPPSHLGGPRIFKNIIKRNRRIRDGSRIDNKNVNEYAQTIFGNASRNNLWLPLELPQVTPKTPSYHQKMQTKMNDYQENCLFRTKICMNTLWICVHYSGTPLGNLWIIYE